MKTQMRVVALGVVIMLLAACAPIANENSTAIPSVQPTPVIGKSGATGLDVPTLQPGIVPTYTVSANAPIAGDLGSKAKIANLSSKLDQLNSRWAAEPNSAPDWAAANGLEIVEGKLFVIIQFRDEQSAKDGAAGVVALGGKVLTQGKTALDVLVPIDKLAKVAALSGVSLVRESEGSMTLQ